MPIPSKTNLFDKLYELAGVTRAEAATKCGLSTESLVEFEKEFAHGRKELNRYIAALGGTLEINVIINEKILSLNGDDAGEVWDVMP